MAELNEAVEVLSDPARRADYDRRRASGTTTPGPAGTRPGSPPRRDDVDLVAVAPAGLSPLVGYLPWFLLIAVMVGIFVFTAFSGGGPDEDAEEAPNGGTVAVRDVRGSCIRTSGGFVLVANCAQTPHEGEIVALSSDASLCPEELVAWEVPQENLVACTDPSTAVP